MKFDVMADFNMKKSRQPWVRGNISGFFTSLLERKLLAQQPENNLTMIAKLVEPSAAVIPTKIEASDSVPTPKPNSTATNSMSIKLSNTNTSLEIGGYLKLDAIYNSVSVGGSGGTNSGDEVLLPGTIPVNPVAGESDQITFHARQSRIWLKSLTPTQLGDLSTYLEMDFFAFQAPGDERVSNSYSPSMRHAYGQLGHFLAGQTWSTFMEPLALPELNDFGGPVGRIFVRQPQIRWSQPIELGEYAMNWHIAIESPKSTLTNASGTRETPDDDRMPDIISRFSLTQPWGTLSLADMLRDIRIDSSIVDSRYGGAVNVAGKINTFDQDDFRFMLAYGNNNRDNNFTTNKIKRRREQIEASIERYLSALETADHQERADFTEAKIQRLQEKVAMLKAQMAKLDTLETELEKTSDKQISLTDPDARSMATSGRGSGMVGYNVQTAVDTQNHLIVAHEVTNVGHDRNQLANMSEQAKAAMGVDEISAIADRGYFSGEEIRKCQEAEITAFVPKCVTSGAKADGRFDKADFIYDTAKNAYHCPAGQTLIWRSSRIEHGMTLHRYWSSACRQCDLKAKCTPGNERRVSR